jgi:hypothetical protein
MEFNIEQYLNDNPSKLSFMNNYLKEYQFSEDFLIKHRIYYDSWKCIRTQKALRPYFCFRYPYDTPEYDSADDWTDYGQVYRYLKEKDYSEDLIESEFKRAINDKKD